MVFTACSLTMLQYYLSTFLIHTHTKHFALSNYFVYRSLSCVNGRWLRSSTSGSALFFFKLFRREDANCHWPKSYKAIDFLSYLYLKEKRNVFFSHQDNPLGLAFCVKKKMRCIWLSLLFYHYSLNYNRIQHLIRKNIK